MRRSGGGEKRDKSSETTPEGSLKRPRGRLNEKCASPHSVSNLDVVE